MMLQSGIQYYYIILSMLCNDQDNETTYNEIQVFVLGKLVTMVLLKTSSKFVVIDIWISNVLIIQGKVEADQFIYDVVLII